MDLKSISPKTITLINPPGIKAIRSLGLNSPNPPIGLAYIAAMLRKYGYRYQVIDMAGEALDQISPFPRRQNFFLQGLSNEQALGRIPEDTDIVGISCLFGVQWPIISELTGLIRKKFPNVFMVAGGEQVTALPEFSLARSSLDALVLGEGEEVFISLIEGLRNHGDWKPLKGIAYRDPATQKAVVNPRRERIVNLDSLPWPDWSSIPMENYIKADLQNGVNRGRSMPILATRGCPFRCSFCSNHHMWGSSFRTRQPQDVVLEMKSYIEKYQIDNFNFQDLTAFVNKEWVLALSDNIRKLGLKITWQLPSGTRIEKFDGEVAKAIYESGCRNIAFAPESASPQILKSVRKEINLKKMEAAIKIAVGHKINLCCFLVIGFPLETNDTLRMTLRFVRKLARLGVADIGVAQFVPYPGSELFHKLLHDGKITVSDEFLLATMNFYLRGNVSYAPALSPEKIYRWQLRLLINFYAFSFIFFPLRALFNISKALFLKREETRYAKFITDVLYRRINMLFRGQKGRPSFF